MVLLNFKEIEEKLQEGLMEEKEEGQPGLEAVEKLMPAIDEIDEEPSPIQERVESLWQI